MSNTITVTSLLNSIPDQEYPLTSILKSIPNSGIFHESDISVCGKYATRFFLYNKYTGNRNQDHNHNRKLGYLSIAKFQKLIDKERELFNTVKKNYTGNRLYGAFRRAGLSVELAKELGY